jgi:predicted deacylase
MVHHFLFLLMRKFTIWITGYWRRLAIMLAVVLGLYYTVLTRIDWWLFQLYRSQVVRDAGAFEAELKKAALPVSVLGQVAYDDVQWPVFAVRRKIPGAGSQACLFGGMHGNEPAGTRALQDLIADLSRNAALYPGVDFLIVPLVNPWGWVHDTRHNGANQDINRNFVAGSSPESDIVKALLATERCDLLIDLHEDRVRRSFYLLTYENAQLPVAEGIAAAVRQSGMEASIVHRREQEFAGERRPTLALYARTHGTLLTYIVETPRNGALDQRVRLQRLALDRLIRSIMP